MEIKETEWVTVLYCTNGRAICEDKNGNIWLSEIPEEFAEPGEAIPLADCTELDWFPFEVQRQVAARLAELTPEEFAALRIAMEAEDDV